MKPKHKTLLWNIDYIIWCNTWPSINIRNGLVARICRSHSSAKSKVARQGRGSIPRFGIILFAHLVPGLSCLLRDIKQVCRGSNTAFSNSAVVHFRLASHDSMLSREIRSQGTCKVANISKVVKHVLVSIVVNICRSQSKSCRRGAVVSCPSNAQAIDYSCYYGYTIILIVICARSSST